MTGNPQEAQRLDLSNPDPTQWQWVDAGSVPVSLQSGTADIGCGVLLPDGRVLQIGANSNTAIYTPATPGDGTNGAGSWVAGPVLPNGLIGGQTNNGSLSAAMLPNGHVLFVGGHAVGGTDTTHFFEFDPVAFDANPQNPQASLTEVTPTNAKLGDAGGAPADADASQRAGPGVVGWDIGRATLHLHSNRHAASRLAADHHQRRRQW